MAACCPIRQKPNANRLVEIMGNAIGGHTLSYANIVYGNGHGKN